MIPLDPETVSDESGIYLIFDRNNSHCGITDRLKAAVGLYYVARLHGLGFHLIHEAGFDLQDYLAPNEILWPARRSDLSSFPGDQAHIRYLAPYSDFPEFRRGCQYICEEYIGNNLLEKWDVPNWQRVWRELFHELFAPAEIVREALADDDMPERYTAVVIRFINSLGYSEDVEYNEPLAPRIQERLMDATLEKVAACAGTSDSPIVVYSDSARFLKRAAAVGYLTTDERGVGNIMNGNVGDYVILRTFVNLFQIAEAERVYSILHLDGFPENSLYKTQYPRYAAIIGGKPFIRC